MGKLGMISTHDQFKFNSKIGFRRLTAVFLVADQLNGV